MRIRQLSVIVTDGIEFDRTVTEKGVHDFGLRSEGGCRSGDEASAVGEQPQV